LTTCEFDSPIISFCIYEYRAGKTVLAAVKDEGLDISGIETIANQISEGKESLLRTAQYVAINDGKKDLVLAMADMRLFSSARSQRHWTRMATSAKCVVIDSNWHRNNTRSLLSKAKKIGLCVAFEPVSVPKAGGIFQPGSSGFQSRQGIDHRPSVFPQHKIDLVTPNQHELAAMHASAKEHDFFESQRWWEIIDSLGIPSSGARDRFVALTNHKMTDAGIPLQSIQLLPYIPTILTKMGAEGVLLTALLKPDDPRLTDSSSAPYILSRTSNGSTEVGGVYMRLFPAVEIVDDVVSVNGVGDTFLGVLVAGLAKGFPLDESLINIAQRGAVMTLRSKEAVSPKLGELAKELNALARLKIDKDILSAAGF